ncbi:MAG: hypothetical protein ACI8PW_001287 [Methylophilaceae bacterium]|jgi:hypothetical protein
MECDFGVSLSCYVFFSLLFIQLFPVDNFDCKQKLSASHVRKSVYVYAVNDSREHPMYVCQYQGLLLIQYLLNTF